MKTLNITVIQKATVRPQVAYCPWLVELPATDSEVESTPAAARAR